jgi:hypothetical protein
VRFTPVSPEYRPDWRQLSDSRQTGNERPPDTGGEPPGRERAAVAPGNMAAQNAATCLRSGALLHLEDVVGHQAAGFAVDGRRGASDGHVYPVAPFVKESGAMKQPRPLPDVSVA